MHHISSFFSGASKLASDYSGILENLYVHVKGGLAQSSSKEIAVAVGTIGLYSILVGQGLNGVIQERSPRKRCFFALVAGTGAVVGSLVGAYTIYTFAERDCLSIVANHMSVPRNSICNVILNKCIVCFCPKLS